jgi:DNA-directed RNA polymerase subunit M/transcription elongation factor TFIIS
MSGTKKKTVSKGNISNRIVVTGKAKPKTSTPKKPSKKNEVEEERYNDANRELYDLYPSTKADIEPTPTLLALLVNQGIIISPKLEEEYVRIPFDRSVLTNKSLNFETDLIDQVINELKKLDNKPLNIANLDTVLEKLGIETLSVNDINMIRKKLKRNDVSILESSPELQEAIDETYRDHEEEIIGLAHNIGDEKTIAILNEKLVDFETWYWQLPIFEKYLNERKLKSEYYRNDQIVKVGIAKCPRCGGENTLGGTRQSGAGDEGFESNYSCLECGFIWKGGRYHNN